MKNQKPKSKVSYTTNQFTWIPIYQELAKELVNWQKRQNELISFLEQLRADGHVITPLNDKDENGFRFLLKEIDPFTFFGVFNRRIGYDQRLSILSRIKQHFKLKSDLPEDFNGVPVLNNLTSWFFPYLESRDRKDISKLWRVFQLALEKSPLKSRDFLQAFDDALKVKQTNLNLTMGLFWIDPSIFLNLDQTNRAHLKIKLPVNGLNAKFYAETVKQFDTSKKSFPQISLEAWGVENERSRMISESKRSYQVQSVKQPYRIENMAEDGVFLAEDKLKEILERLQAKKALILQGPPGVGKTFIAQKLGQALIGEIDRQRLEMVQFHQSYSYDDFVRGYRPLPDKAGSFRLQNGVFYNFCQRAANDPNHEYVFIIDEINRGNLSQIFGELLMLIETDKRSPEYAVQLIYHAPNEARFFIPSNLYLIGLMNVADRSLAMVDYALRRRFAFVALKPQYKNDLYRQWLLDRSMNADMVNLIIERMSALNQEIKEDPLLGENYQIGHSFFCPNGDDFSGPNNHWYQQIIQTEIVPLLREYWFDNQTKAEDAERRLLA
ncbi:MAG: AAA family ATPase [Anaerolineales bacterium]|nr:AAA family ATPase [Anaerolineales bacterium]